MKTSKFLYLLGVAIALFIAVVLPNEVAAMVQDVNVHDLTVQTPTLGLTALVSLANIDGSSEGSPNPGGMRKLYIIHAKDIVGVWPKLGDIVDGEITILPELVEDAGLAEYAFPDGTFSVTDATDGDPGYMSNKHMVGFNLAGFRKELTKEIQKHLNAGSVVIGQMNDDQYVVAGSSDNAIYIKSAFSSGGKGSDKRGYTCKGEQDGFMWGVTPLKTSLVATLPLLPLPEAP
ncbi:hypothetical protein [Spirosoma endbachense]|uniref:Uncharacterized protein n=1 Tax=Spirosoma endbachense TaxID=2666025 RepID=A0A6P1W054_9BACT|nr:hypothetical protein [Spirosoma endbachense]QHV97958.1 hypothetical protein GJR95_24410 [Spirosoma endbachense]